MTDHDGGLGYSGQGARVFVTDWSELADHLTQMDRSDLPDEPGEESAGEEQEERDELLHDLHTSAYPFRLTLDPNGSYLFDRGKPSTVFGGRYEETESEIRLHFAECVDPPQFPVAGDGAFVLQWVGDDLRLDVDFLPSGIPMLFVLASSYDARHGG